MTKLQRIVVTIMMFLSFGGSLAALPTEQAEAKARTVWIAPHHGRKHHHSRYCRGLNRARSKKHVSIKWARSHHYKICHWC